MGHRATVLMAATVGTVTGAAAAGYVLHVVPANGGGVDRYVRDICAHRSRDCILHVAQEQCVFESVTARRYFPIDRQRMTDSSVVAALGRPSLLHAHSTLFPVRERVASLSKALGVDYVLTLHDIDFAGTFRAVDDNEREARLGFVRNAAQRIVPSAFISALLSTALAAETTRQLIENGVDVDATGGESTAELTTPGQFQVVVVGALGLHKGLNFLHDVVTSLPLDIRVVAIGYADGQITPGWLQTDRVWVHGAFEPRDLAGLIRGYGARLALFPNRQPESYSYALSDVWRVGLPAIGPAAGAIGERIAQTGAGWTYEADSSAEMVAARLLDCLAGTDSLQTYVYEAAAALLTTRDMVERLNRQYEEIMRTPEALEPDAEATPQIKRLESVAAAHLNGSFFRSELQKLSGDIAFSHQQALSANAALGTLTHEYEGRGLWIDTLETNLAECKAEIVRIEDARKREHAEALQARVNADEAHEQYATKLQQDVSDTLAVAHRQERSIAIYEHALSMIPPFVRRWLLARAARAASIKTAQ